MVLPFFVNLLKGKSKYHIALQFSQVMNMFVLALIIPYLIGISEYGYYASMYSVPGFFQGMLETYLMLLLFNSGLSKSSLIHFAKIVILSFIITGVIVYLTLGREVVFITLVFYSLMLLRSIALAFAYHCLKVKVTSIIFSELIVFAVYFLIVLDVNFGSKVLGLSRTHDLPMFMVCSAAIPSAFFLFWKVKPYFKNLLISEKNQPFELHNLLARIYEDLFFSLAPLVTFKLFGSKTAGEYRLILSIFKGISKLFPFKYELLLRNIREGVFSFKYLRNLSFLFVSFGIITTICLSFFIKMGYFNSISHMYLILMSSGFVITILVVYPYAITKYKFLPRITILLYFILYIASYKMGIAFFVYSFVLINAILYFIIYKKVISINI